MTDTPDWKKAIDRGTSMHTILAEKKSAEGPDWMKTPDRLPSMGCGQGGTGPDLIS